MASRNNIKFVIFLTTCCVFVSAFNGWGKSIYGIRNKRDTGGALDIVTNHADPIHADVKSDGTDNGSEKPCNQKGDVASIEDGVGFKVTAPKDVEVIPEFEGKSFRKSLPIKAKPSLTKDISQKHRKLELVKSINRLIAMLILSICVIIEFYPVLVQVFHMITGF